jgi:uncharacterized protein (TIGR00369 family)
MDKPRLSLNDDTDYGLCFACGPRNAAGLHLTFQRAGDTVITTFRGREEHQGFPGHVHGGIISALLDEVMSRVPLLDGRWAMTARMDVRFRRPVMVGQDVTAVAERVREMRGFVEASGRVLLPDGEIAADATGAFKYLGDDALRGMSADYPKLAREWMRGA